MLSTAEAAGIIGVNESRVRALITAKLIKARKIGRDWYIDRASVERRAAKRAKKS